MPFSTMLQEMAATFLISMVPVIELRRTKTVPTPFP